MSANDTQDVQNRAFKGPALLCAVFKLSSGTLPVIYNEPGIAISLALLVNDAEDV